MGNYGLNVIGGIFEFFYVLLPVLSITILAYKFASETGRRTGSSLLFFSLVFYFIAVYESFYITARFGVIVSTELIFLQAILHTSYRNRRQSQQDYPAHPFHPILHSSFQDQDFASTNVLTF